MSNILTFPYDLPAFQPAEFAMGIRSNVEIRTARDFRIRTSQLPGTRWVLRMVLRNNTRTTGYQPRVEAFVAGIEGQAGRFIMPYLPRLVPAGTMRGNPVVAAAAPRGSRSIQITVTPGETVLAGDMLGVTTGGGLQVVMARTITGIGTGTLTVEFAGPLMATAPVGYPVQWNAPPITWILTDPEVMVTYLKSGAAPGVVIEAVEV
jgi:hypothetical protein